MTDPSTTLRDQRAACEQCIASARTCLKEECLAPHWPVYHRLIGVYQARIVEIDGRLPVAPVYPGGRRAELSTLCRAYRARQTTPREFGQRLQWLMRGGR